MIYGYFYGDCPAIEAAVSLQVPNRGGEVFGGDVLFLIDTGSPYTILFPPATNEMSVQDPPKRAGLTVQSELADLTRVEIEGFGGGKQEVCFAKGSISFSDGQSIQPVTFDLVFCVAMPTDENKECLSLLGRNVLRLLHMCYWCRTEETPLNLRFTTSKEPPPCCPKPWPPSLG